MQEIVLLYDKAQEQTVEEIIIPGFQHHLRASVAYHTEQQIIISEQGIVVVFLSDDQLKEFLPLALQQQWQVGFLPHPDMVHGRQEFGVSDKLDAAIDNLKQADSTQLMDVLLANGRPVFDTVVIGSSLSVVYGSTEATRIKRVAGRVWNLIKLFNRPRLKQYTFVYKEGEGDGKETIDTAALGILVVQHGKSALLSRKLLEDSVTNDGMLHALVLAPESVLGLLSFGITSLFRAKSNGALPTFAAHMKTSKLRIQSESAMDFSVDDVLQSTKELELEVRAKCLQVVPDLHVSSKPQAGTQEVFKVHALPRNELRDELLKGPLPFIYHATTEQFRELFTTLRENATASSSYRVLMFLSTFIATLGLFGNSSPVIIGAMILAPLMSPIISLSMGMLRQDSQLIRSSFKAILLGLLLGYICAMVLTWIIPLTTTNLQIISRTRPNLLDLGIAIGSGVAGAYAHAKKEIAKTLAGVAIAVALVPPLAVSGIGIGWWDWSVFSGALLLLVTNLVGIVLAAAITFLFLGYSPFHLAKKGLLISLICMLGILTPLGLGFSRIVQEADIIQRLNGHQINDIVLREVVVRGTNPLQLSLKVITGKPLTEEELVKVKQEVEQQVGEEVELEIIVGIKM